MLIELLEILIDLPNRPKGWSQLKYWSCLLGGAILILLLVCYIAVIFR